jgi:putative DNA primase/helicase
MPSARDGSHGFWRRVRVVPFKARFEGEQMDKDLQRKLRAEAPGILRWIIEGACEWVAEGLGSCAVVEEASNEYRQEQDTIARFLAERTEEVNHATIAARELFGEYIVWCEGEDVPAPTQKHFASKMAERGYDKKKTKRGMEYQNLRLLEEPPAISNPCDF